MAIEQKARGEILTKIVTWASKTSAHGFKNVFESDRLVKKIIWIVILISSISFCIFQVALMITNYFQFNVITSLKLVYEAPSSFPAVVFCNLNAYNGIFVRHHMNSVLNSKNFSQSFFMPVDFVDLGVDYFKSTFEAEALKGQFDLHYSGFYFNEMLISCRFQGKECNESNFEMYYDYHYGNCFRFNGNKSNVIKSTKSGWKNGLRLELFVGDLDTQQQFTYKSGVRVIVHNQSSVVFSDEDGIDVSVGTQTNIGITRTMINRKPYPYSYCIDSYLTSENLSRNPFLRKIIPRYPQMEGYSQNFCLKACLQEFLMEMCECFDLKLPRPENSSLNYTSCETTTELECIQYEESEFYQKEIEKCYKHCPNECFKILYDTKMSFAKYPSKWYTSILNSSYLMNFFDKTDLDFLQLQQTTLMINVFYEQMSYNLIEEYPEISIDVLLAMVGGNLGLFMGISVLSLVEIAEFCLNLIYFFTVRNLTSKIKKIEHVKTKVEQIHK